MNIEWYEKRIIRIKNAFQQDYIESKKWDISDEDKKLYHKKILLHVVNLKTKILDKFKEKLFMEYSGDNSIDITRFDYKNKEINIMKNIFEVCNINCGKDNIKDVYNLFYKLMNVNDNYV